MKTYKAKKTFLHGELGRVQKGQEFKATDAQVSGVKRFVEEYKTKVEPDRVESNKSEPKRKKSDD